MPRQTIPSHDRAATPQQIQAFRTSHDRHISLQEGAAKHGSTEGETKVVPMVRDVSYGELIVELVRARRILDLGITNLIGSFRISVFVPSFLQDLFVVAQASPREVRNRVAVMCHTPVIKSETVVEIGQRGVANAGLPHSVDVIDGDAMDVQVERAMHRLRSAERVARDYQLPAWQSVQSRKDVGVEALIGVVKTGVAIAIVAPHISVTFRREHVHVINPCLEIRIGAHERDNACSKRGVVADDRGGISPRGADHLTKLEIWNVLAWSARPIVDVLS